jgi:acetyl-CoA acetyltransferase
MRASTEKPLAASRFLPASAVTSLPAVTSSKAIYDPCGLSLLQCCPTSDGAAAAILVSETFAREVYGINVDDDKKPAAVRGCPFMSATSTDSSSSSFLVEIVGQSLSSDVDAGTLTASNTSGIRLAGFDVTKAAVKTLTNVELAGTNVKISDADVVELHDCFSVNEIMTYIGLGFVDKAQDNVKNIDESLVTNIDGSKLEAILASKRSSPSGQKLPIINPSGGLIAKGHPLGATGVAQACEIVWQLRGNAESRQVQDAKIGLTHNIGLGGACVLTAYQRKSFQPVSKACNDITYKSHLLAHLQTDRIDVRNVKYAPIVSDHVSLLQWEYKGCTDFERPIAKATLSDYSKL